VLRALSSPNLDIRRKTLDIALDLITSRNIDEVRRTRRAWLQDSSSGRAVMLLVSVMYVSYVGLLSLGWCSVLRSCMHVLDHTCTTLTPCTHCPCLVPCTGGDGAEEGDHAHAVC
jgi:hypothetical protein